VQHQHISTSAHVLKRQALLHMFVCSISTSAHVLKRQALLHMFVCSISTSAHELKWQASTVAHVGVLNSKPWEQCRV